MKKTEPLVLRPNEGPQEDFVNSSNYITFYGGGAGGGKTFGLLLDALRHIDDPEFFAVYFRRTTTQLDNGLWPEAKKMYMPFLMYQSGPNKGKFIKQNGKEAKIIESKHTIIFPSGATIKFSYLDRDANVDIAWQGTQLSAVYFDEFTHFTEYMFNYLRTRLRSAAKAKAYMKCSLNPDQDHHVFRWVEPFLDKDGYPDKELCGKTRYFIYTSSVLHTSWDREELLKQFPGKKPRTYTFIPSLIHDNPQLLENEPDYADNLEANSAKEVKALLEGCWYFRADAGTYFNREWCKVVNEIPRDANRVRSWDLASSEPTSEYKNPDYTASVRMSRANDGYYYIETGKRFRKKPGSRDNEMIKVAERDTDDVVVTIPRDPGAGGKAVAESLSKLFAANGFVCRQIAAGNVKGMKVKRFTPFSSAAENGLIRIVKSGWDSQEELDQYLEELETFTGDGKGKDDWVDATADAFNELSTARYIPDFTPHLLNKINEFKNN